MAKKINEQQAIQFLKDRIELLLKEVNKYQAALDALTNEETAIDKASVGKKVQKKAKPAKEIRIAKNSKQGKMAPGRATSSRHQPLAAQDQFNPTGSWDERIAYTLGKINSGHLEDIVSFISEKQPEIDPIKLRNAVKFRLSLLLSNKKIMAKKNGKTYEYSLINQSL